MGPFRYSEQQSPNIQDELQPHEPSTAKFVTEMGTAGGLWIVQASLLR